MTYMTDAVLWVGLQCVIVVFPDQTNYFLASNSDLS